MFHVSECVPAIIDEKLQDHETGLREVMTDIERVEQCTANVATSEKKRALQSKFTREVESVCADANLVINTIRNAEAKFNMDRFNRIINHPDFQLLGCETDTLHDRMERMQSSVRNMSTQLSVDMQPCTHTLYEIRATLRSKCETIQKETQEAQSKLDAVQASIPLTSWFRNEFGLDQEKSVRVAYIDMLKASQHMNEENDKKKRQRQDQEQETPHKRTRAAK